MAIADKLTYLNTTKTLLREAITRAGHYLSAADPFRGYPFALLKDEHSLKLDFVRGEYIAKNWRDGTVSRVGLGNIMTTTRGSGGGRYNHLGVYEWVGNNVARIDHDPATVAISTSSVVVGAGLKTFTVSSQYPVGQYVRATADASNWISGRVIASTATSVTIWVDRVVGAGAFASWTLIRVRGLLVEESRTNLLTLITNAVEANATAEPVPGGLVGPNRLAMTSWGGQSGHRVGRVVTGLVVGNTYSLTWVVEAAASPWILIGFAHNASPTPASRAYIDAETGVLGTSEISGITSVKMGALISVTATVVATTTAMCLIVGGAAANNVPAYPGGALDLYIHHMQLEPGSLPSSQIPTTNAQVTRAADQCVVADLSDWYRVDEGAMQAVWSSSGSAALNSPAWVLSGTGTNIIRQRAEAGRPPRLDVYVAGGSQADLTAGGTVLPGTTRNTAATWKTDYFQLAADGSLSSVDTSGSVPTVSLLRIGLWPSGIAMFSGHIESLSFIPRAPSGTELQRLTS